MQMTSQFVFRTANKLSMSVVRSRFMALLFLMIRLLVLEPNPNLPVREVVRYLSRVRFLGLRAMPTFALDSAMSLSGLNVNFRHFTTKISQSSE